MFRYKLRTLLILLGIGPPALAAMLALKHYADVSLAVAGWFSLLVFALYVGMSDARQHSRWNDE